MKLAIVFILSIVSTPIFAELTPIMPYTGMGNSQPITLNITTEGRTVLEKCGGQMDSLQVQRNQQYQYQPLPEPYEYKPMYSPKYFDDE